MLQSHKRYYKGNPFTNQNYLPSSSKHNRIQKNYLVQFPQGNSHFENSSRKRQFSSLHHHSQIKQTQLFEENPQPHYQHSNLDICDIQGANPNSISQAVRNRLKSTRLRKTRQFKNNNYHFSGYQSPQQFREQVNIGNTLRNISQPKKCYNYHFIKPKRVTTEPIQLTDNPEDQEQHTLYNKQYGKSLESIRQRKPSTPKIYDSIKKIEHQPDKILTHFQQNPHKQAQFRRNLNDKKYSEPLDKERVFNNHHFYGAAEIRRLNPTYLSSVNNIGYVNSHRLPQLHSKW